MNAKDKHPSKKHYQIEGERLTLKPYAKQYV